MWKRRKEKVAFFAACVVLIFLGGVGVGRFRVFPYPALEFGMQSVRQVSTEFAMLTGMWPTAFVGPALYPGRGVTTRNADSLPGLTLLAGFFDRSNEVRLIRPDGTVVRRWPLRYFQIFPEPSHIQPPSSIPWTEWFLELDSALALPDGSVVADFGNAGLVELDRCGSVRWTVARMTHHSIERTSDGGFWVPGRKYEGTRSAFPPLKVPYAEDTILKISAAGKVLTEISIPALLFTNGLQSLLFANGRVDIDPEPELVHLNDVEELSPSLAPQFPQFSAGDVIVSLRNHNLVMVVDPATKNIKWHQTGPWIRQHDPDFRPNGRISIFNNNVDNSPTGTVFGGSNIMEVDPVSRQTEVVYGGKAGQRMYTATEGRHQYLSNGNILITDFQNGRALEVDAAGSIVWEYINRISDDEIAVITQATRYPDGYFTVDDWSCR